MNPDLALIKDAMLVKMITFVLFAYAAAILPYAIMMFFNIRKAREGTGFNVISMFFSTYFVQILAVIGFYIFVYILDNGDRSVEYPLLDKNGERGLFSQYWLWDISALFHQANASTKGLFLILENLKNSFELLAMFLVFIPLIYISYTFAGSYRQSQQNNDTGLSSVYVKTGIVTVFTIIAYFAYSEIAAIALFFPADISIHDVSVCLWRENTLDKECVLTNIHY